MRDTEVDAVAERRHGEGSSGAARTADRQLTIDADAAVRTALATCSSPPKGEVACVAGIVVKAVPAIAIAWGTTLAAAGCKLSMRGVFCHGAPQVDRPPGTRANRCELADLLVVMDRATGRRVERRATLIQAKMDKGGSVHVGSGMPMRQLALYLGWPSFAFTSRSYDPRPRDFAAAVPGGSTTDVGRYGAIDLSVGAEQWRQLDPTAPRPFATIGAQTLGEFLADVADAQPHRGVDAVHFAGDPRSPAAPPLDDWSYKVAELLHVTYGLTHVALVRAGGSGRRGVTVIVARIASGPNWRTATIGGDGLRPDRRGVAPGPVGISIIHGLIERMP